MVARFEEALAKPGDPLERLFHRDSYWRDILALTWRIRTIRGSDKICQELGAHAGRVRPSELRTDPDRTAPRRVTRAGTDAIEAIFRFETGQGRGIGVVRLTPDADDGNRLKAWTLLTALDELNRRAMRPRHVVMATGVSGIPNLPDIPGLPNFAGRVLHSSQYDDGGAWQGKDAIVIGTGNSGHDIAQDLHSSGANVTLVQRSPTLIVNIEPSAQLPYALYDEGPPLEDCDLITTSIPFALMRKSHIRFTEQAKSLDRELLDRLEDVGFELDFGEDGTGWQFKYLTRGGGYYFNVGCSDLIVEGKIRLAQFSDIAEFVAAGVRLQRGDTITADLIVLATGYKPQEHLIRELFGDEIADRVGPIWGFGDGEELRNMFTRTPQPGLWFIAGSFAQCRIYSKYLALQIKACETGLLS